MKILYICYGTFQPMQGILQKLKFTKLQIFMKLHFAIDCLAPDIYIRCDIPIPAYDFTKRLSNADIIRRAFDLADNTNQLKNGYSSTSQMWFSTNTTTNLLRTHKWGDIFEALGDNYSIFVLTQCFIVEEVGKELVFICGDFNKLAERNVERPCIRRDCLFFGKQALRPLELDAITAYLWSDIDGYEDLKMYASNVLEQVIRKYNRLPLGCIFKSFFGQPNQDTMTTQSTNDLLGSDESIYYDPSHADVFPNSTTQASSPRSHDLMRESATNSPIGSSIDTIPIVESELPYSLLIDFLFLIAKKSFKPIFTFTEYKILKGKLALLIKRNQYETVTNEELQKHFSLSKMKIFLGKHTKHEFAVRCKVASRLLIYIFNHVFVNIMTYFFYSTVCTHTRQRVSYFKRMDWNTTTNKFYQDFLAAFKPAERNSHMGTLRCIPRPDGFRVITNCAVSFRPLDKTKPATGANLKKCYKSTKTTKSVNSVVGPVHPILRLASHGQMGNSLEGVQDIHRRLYDYLSHARGPQFLVKLDLAHCFDNLQHDELERILPELLKSPGYYVSEYKGLRQNQIGTGFEYKWFRRANEYLKQWSTITPGYFGKVHHSAGQMSGQAPGLLESPEQKIILKEVRHKYYIKGELVSLVHNLISQFVVMRQNRCYSFTRGVPQGCIISPMLCNLYYAALDRKYFSNVFNKGTVIRYVDDFLIITPCLGEIAEFFKRANALRCRGFVFNPQKIETNLRPDIFDQIYHNGGTDPDIECASIDRLVQDTNQLSTQPPDSLMVPHSAPSSVVWCGWRVFNTGINIKARLDEKYFRYNVSLASGSQGRRIFTKIMRTFYMRASFTLINFRNKKLGENIYDIFFLLGRRARILFLRADFVNIKFMDSILALCRKQMIALLVRRGILFDADKVEAMARKAFKNSSARSVHRKEWHWFFRCIVTWQIGIDVYVAESFDAQNELAYSY